MNFYHLVYFISINKKYYFKIFLAIYAIEKGNSNGKIFFESQNNKFFCSM